MKKIYILTSILIALLLSACGGGGGDSGSFNGSSTTIAIPNCETYENIQAGDTIEQVDSNTSIKTVFNTDGSKKVCVLTGSANIIRQ